MKMEERVTNKFVLRGGISYKIVIELDNSYHVSVELFNTKIFLLSVTLVSENWKGIQIFSFFKKTPSLHQILRGS